MRISRTFMICSLIIAILLCLHAVAEAQPGQIVGRVTDSESGSALPNANILIQGTTIGAASDIHGNYVIRNVPPGEHEITVRYLGYQEITFTVEVDAGERVEHNVGMRPRALRGEEVVVTAQAEGQWQAINQQLASRTVTNIVSRAQIQQLPEATAAEAVGRLPGVSLEREGGEGTKVVIRGMSSKYSLIQIDGVNMTATGAGDRSVDMSMISPYMLEGIELTKSVMANQEATATGGIVNFRMRTPPDEPTFNVVSQGGYNSLRSTYRDVNLTVGGSNRFFANRLGVFAQINYEEKDGGSQQLGGVNFNQERTDGPVFTNSMQLMDIFRDVQRLGGTVVLDYNLPSTQIRASNFFSRIDREETRYQNHYNFVENRFRLSMQDTPERWLRVMTNSLRIDHEWRNLHINTAFSHSFSENTLPAGISFTNEATGSPDNVFGSDRRSGFNVDVDPETIPDLMEISLRDAVRNVNMGGVGVSKDETRERDLTAELNLTYSFDITNNINVDLHTGGMYRHKTKEFDTESFSFGFFGGAERGRRMLIEHFWDRLSERTKEQWETNTMQIKIWDFLDHSYTGGDFLDGRYDFGYIYNRYWFREMHDLFMPEYNPDVFEIGALIQRSFVGSNYYDYDGTEDYHAFYLMPEINLGSDVVLIPGVRYESNRTEYTGYRGSRLGVLRGWQPTPIDTVTRVRENEFFLPMINVYYKPTQWLTLKAGYTHTLQRPNYTWIRPGWLIGQTGALDNLGNFRLKPEQSENWDIQLSVFSHEIGLLSVGAFHKTITDMIFWTGTRAVTDTTFFELPSSMYRQRAAYPVNNEFEAVNYGFEIEWQSNFWYLPGLLRGLVINFNYTRNISEAEYLRTRIRTELDENFRPIYTNEDTTYTAPLIHQPDHLLNLTLGFDYRDFSIRGAMRFTSGVFTSANWHESLRGFTDDFYRYDLQVRQGLPLPGMEIFMNIFNLTNEIERDLLNHMNFARNIESYGRSVNIGLRYQF